MSEAVFKAKAPRYMRLLMADFGFSIDDAAAIMGNAGAESGGLSMLQELKPTVAGSRGGWGWFQWTGPRRRGMEEYCKRNRLDPASDDANYKWLWVELHGTEMRAVNAVKNASGLAAKVMAFEKSFERSGIPHYDSRLRWAEKAKIAYREVPPAPVTNHPAVDVHTPITAQPPVGNQTKSPVTYVALGGGVGAALIMMVNWLVERFF